MEEPRRYLQSRCANINALHRFQIVYGDIDSFRECYFKYKEYKAEYKKKEPV